MSDTNLVELPEERRDLCWCAFAPGMECLAPATHVVEIVSQSQMMQACAFHRDRYLEQYHDDTRVWTITEWRRTHMIDPWAQEPLPPEVPQ